MPKDEVAPSESLPAESADLEEEFRLFQLNVDVCKNSSAFERGVIGCLAIARDDPGICNTIEGSEEDIWSCKDTYYEMKIYETYDISLCNMINNKERRNLCLSMDNPCAGVDPKSPTDECVAYGTEFCKNFKYSVSYSVASDEANKVICKEIFSDEMDLKACETLSGTDKALCLYFILFHKALAEKDIELAKMRNSISLQIDNSLTPGMNFMAYVAKDETWCKADKKLCTRNTLLDALRRGVFDITLTCSDCVEELNFLDKEDCNFIKSPQIKEACLASI